MDAFLTWGLEEQTPEQGSELPTTVKSEEELAKFTVDEGLSDTERCVLFLNGGQIIQQRHAVANLPALIRTRGRAGWEAVSGPLKAALNRLDTDCQIEAAEVFAYIAKERLMTSNDLQACLLPLILRNVNKEKSEEETEAWLHALFQLIPLTDKETLKSEVLSMALSKGDMDDNAASRIICARILGAMASCMSKDDVEKLFFKRALKMCQDVDNQVRLNSCRQLAALGRTAGKEAVQHTILEELLELLKDEDMQVRSAAFTSLISLLELLPSDIRHKKVMPVLRDHLHPYDLDANMQKCVARQFGHMIAVIKGDMDAEDPLLFYGCYRHLSCKQDVELRRVCAQQLGTLLKAAVSSQPFAFMQHFNETYQAFATDIDEEVRLAAATQLHEVARFSGKDYCCQLMTRPLVQLLRDESSKVQGAVLPHLTITLSHFAADNSSQKQSALDEIVRALMDLEANSARNWRLQVNLASCFPCFHQIFSSDQVHEHFLPMAFRFLSNSAAAARPVVAEGIACFLRFNKREKQRAELFLQLIREYARGKSYAQRIAFAEVCKHMIKRFSSKFVKEWVFDLCLELLYDPVPNVRLQVTHVLPTLKQTVRLPEDVDLLERLNNAISNSMTDNDRDVSQTARQINESYKRVPVRMGGSIGTLVDASGGAMAAYEAEDKRREAEEVDCTFSPEDIKEIKAEILQMTYKKKPSQNELASAGPKSAINRRAGPDAVKQSGAAVSIKSSGSGGLAGSKQAAGGVTASVARSAQGVSAGAAARKPDTATSRLATTASQPSVSAATKPGTLTTGRPAPAPTASTQRPAAVSNPLRPQPVSTTAAKSTVPAAKPAASATVAGGPLKRK